MNAVVFLPLSQGKVTTIDASDFELVGRFKWYAAKSRNTFYAQRTVIGPGGAPTIELLHRALRPHCKQVDHRDGNGLNNTGENLRESNSSHNRRAKLTKSAGKSSRFRGVHKPKNTSKWRAQVTYLGELFYAGLFSDEEEAARAYDESARALGFSEEAMNFPLAKS
jgi:hypothetical protein